MGLREMKAERTRQQMEDAALELFLSEGYDQTTMEQIAERAEVGTTTLYRYFPTKDQLLLDPLVEAIDPARHLRTRPADEPLDIALGAALLASAAAFDGDDNHIADLRRLVDAAPTARAKLWDRYLALRDELELIIGSRLGRSSSDPVVRLTAGFTLDVFQMADRRGDDSRSHLEIITELLGGLGRLEVIVPRLPDA
jgi:AcrR family transcriptional regulator